MLGSGLAICAGCCAALASVSAKFAMNTQLSLSLCLHGYSLLGQLLRFLFSRNILSVPDSGILLEGQSTALCDMVLLYVRVMCFALIFLFNALMWTFFVKSLQKCSSSVEATVTNTASNFFISAIIGWLAFGEVLNLMWWSGASLIVVGLLLIHHGNKEKTEGKEKES